ncbi:MULTISPECIES: hypothetical protein [unclassified Cyanobium]|jgi:hypothetical protein|uniref:hypothetical protein n=1 Tax=unclassified Cyanobium TaxID=2627006 RepID=UPI001861BB53|nr:MULTISPECIES: hypothetical protein [unclassified Cyanobium]QNI69505.1 putative conserved secreted protein [Cyanobium sp. NS01]
MLPTTWGPWALAATGLALLSSMLPPPPAAEAQATAVERPPGLVVLDERPRPEGMLVLGVYGPKPDATIAGLWRMQLWRQLGPDVSIQTDTVRCDKEEPMWITEDGGRLVIRSLNPGGVITPANRVDHLVWWAVCHPEQAGRDPAELKATALELGYSTTLRESEQVLPGRPR